MSHRPRKELTSAWEVVGSLFGSGRSAANTSQPFLFPSWQCDTEIELALRLHCAIEDGHCWNSHGGSYSAPAHENFI